MNPIPSSFKVVFLVVVGLTVLSFVGIGLLAVFGTTGADPAKISLFQQNFAKACEFGWQAGLGAILGLIGGKVAD